MLAIAWVLGLLIWLIVAGRADASEVVLGAGMSAVAVGGARAAARAGIGRFSLQARVPVLRVVVGIVRDTAIVLAAIGRRCLGGSVPGVWRTLRLEDPGDGRAPMRTWGISVLPNSLAVDETEGEVLYHELVPTSLDPRP